jgi:hypothetical protein
MPNARNASGSMFNGTSETMDAFEACSLQRAGAQQDDPQLSQEAESTTRTPMTQAFFVFSSSFHLRASAPLW